MHIYTKKTLALLFTGALALGLAGCGGSEKKAEKAANAPKAPKAQKVLIGIRQDLFPTSYIDESGKPAGFDIEIAKRIDELLPEYEFEYEAVSQAALLTGLQSGKYKAAVAGFYDNKSRREKYLFPQENIGGNLIGLAVRKEDANIKNLQQLHDAGKTMTPIATTSGMYAIAVNYNKANPDKQVKLIPSDWNDEARKFKWLKDKEYDAIISSKNLFDQYVKRANDKDVVFNPFTAIKTYSLFHPEQKELAAAYDRALQQVKKEGYASKVSEKYFGEDVFKYIKK